MRRFPALLLALVTATTALTGCSPSGGSGRLADGDSCYEYTYPAVPMPTATTVVGVTVWPCPTTAPTTTPVTTTVAPTTTTPVTTTPPATTTTTTPPTVGVYPNPGNTGARGVTLAVISGDYTAPAGAVIDGKRITGRLIIGTGGATIRNSEIYGGITNYPSRGRYTVTDSTIGAPSGCNGGIGLSYENYTAERVHVRSIGDAFRGGQAASGVSDILIRDSYARLCSQPGFHSDGYQGYGAGTNVRLIHNTLDQRGALDSTAPIFNADSSKALWAEDNLVAGGGFTLRIYDVAGQKSTVRNNKVVDGSWQYGPVNSSCNDQWSGNTIVRIDSEYRVTSTVRPMPCSG